ncbi:hypothetical protein MVLG_05629 [Microbotryum lychnidis-dioicae p1A1 Lamole]|uniref:Major facilitator superfamily (MFS) profile domain-containing protein n=1 Tax=Microbotryum lychnidis-dioicae (strain p1A1 Lamole / MvSl-1064) TaxID=683840 RepID=U5HET9_USTV1|nr:hypothetical protein MVLG_05629 [Microbotryum lychnidis-dioicae p1A1 Lamole]|eukprot:KDE03937.1 hypothetical protein MVLG_05629 [Microbotryum lychnidis-dioicae p1A1 Lamole]
MPSKTTVTNWCYGIAACMAMILYGYDASTFNAVQGSKHWVAYFNKPTPSQIGTINSVYVVGNIVSGFFAAPWVSSRYGRRVPIMLGALLVIVATFVQTFAPRGHLNAFLGGRFIVGLGQGLALPNGPVYVSEVTRPHVRGRLLGFWQLFYSVGAFVAFWINYATSKHTAKLGEWDWKLVLIFQLVCPVILLITMPLVCESPRWLAEKGRVDDARRALRRIRDTEEEIESELLEIREALEFEQNELKSTGFYSAYKLLWTDKSLRRRFIFALIINAGQQLTGQGSLVSYSTAVYKKVFTNLSTVALINALNATFGIVFTLTAVFFIERLGRKGLLTIGAIGQALCMLIVAVVGSETPFIGAKHDSKTLPVGVSIVFLLFLFIFFYKPSWGATVWIWTSEVFSFNVRIYAVGAATQTQNVANIIMNQFFPQFLAKAGFRAFYLFAGINVGLAIFCIFVLPETRGVKLEEMDVIFGGKNHVDGGADMMAGQSTYSAEKPGVEHHENDLTSEELAKRTV